MDDKYKFHGAFSWCELLSTDVPDAKSKLFGWTLEPAPIPGMEYTLVKYGGEQMGGIMTIPPAAKGMPPCWGGYVTVDDVDATAKLAVELGCVYAATGHPSGRTLLRAARPAGRDDQRHHLTRWVAVEAWAKRVLGVNTRWPRNRFLQALGRRST